MTESIESCTGVDEEVQKLYAISITSDSEDDEIDAMYTCTGSYTPDRFDPNYAQNIFEFPKMVEIPVDAVVEMSRESSHLVRETQKVEDVNYIDEYDNEREMQDTFGSAYNPVPFNPASKSRTNMNRLSVLSMASSIAAIAPFISSMASGSPGASPNVFTEYKTDTPPEKPTPASYPWMVAPTVPTNDRLSQLMQRAVLNSKRKRSQGITEQTFEQWSSNLETCFEDIPEESMAFDVPDLHADSHKSGKSKYTNTWNRLSKALFFGNNDHKPSTPSFTTSTSFATLADSSSYLTASESFISQVPSLMTSVAESSIEQSIGCRTIGDNSFVSTKKQTKRKKVARFFRSIFGSSVHASVN